MRFASKVLGLLSRLAIGIAVGSLALTIAACGKTVVHNWMPVDPDMPLPSSPKQIAAQAIAIDIEQLRPPSNKLISLSLPDGGIITTEITAFKEIGENQFIWRGTIEGEPGSTVKFSVVNDTLVGDIVTANGRMYRIRHLKKGVALIEELDPAKFPLEESQGSHDVPKRSGELQTDPEKKEVRPNPGAVRPDPRTIRPDSHPDQPDPITGSIAPISFHGSSDETIYVDVMVLYTAEAFGVESDPDAVLGRINGLIDDTNTTYVNSKVKHRFHLAHAEETTYVENSNGDLYADWMALKFSSAVPQLSGVSTQRNNYGADIVVLLTKDSLQTGSCGESDQLHSEALASCKEAFAVVPIDCATMTYSFAHETGHVMGADHDRGTTVNLPPFKYSRGYIASSNAWRTIMAYPNASCNKTTCQRIPRWSNPLVTHKEKGSAREPTGSDSESAPANNAETLNQTADTVAMYSDQCASQAPSST